MDAQTAKAPQHSALDFGFTDWGPRHCLTSPVLQMCSAQFFAEAIAMPTGMPRSKCICLAALYKIERCQAAFRVAGR
jgi:hypothetical protein